MTFWATWEEKITTVPNQVSICYVLYILELIAKRNLILRYHICSLVFAEEGLNRGVYRDIFTRKH